MLKDGIVTKDTHPYTLRIAPTFYINTQQIDYLIQILVKHLS
jgi:acetylornithine/succinyldiaminopimelate/putrescine aminotransferase